MTLSVRNHRLSFSIFIKLKMREREKIRRYFLLFHSIFSRIFIYVLLKQHESSKYLYTKKNQIIERKNKILILKNRERERNRKLKNKKSYKKKSKIRL